MIFWIYSYRFMRVCISGKNGGEEKEREERLGERETGLYRGEC